MKFSKRSLLLISIFVFFILVYFLNSIHSQRIDERNTLNDKLTLTQSKVRAIPLDALSRQNTELQQQLAQTTSQLNAARTTLSQSINKTFVVDTLLSTAKAYNLEITEMTLSGLTDASLDKLPTSAVFLTVTLEGEVVNLVGFSTKLNTLFNTGAIQSAIISSSANTTIEKPQATIKLTIYTVQGR